ncbi:MAG: hypothetical protein QW505_04150 [Thermoplasmata archaeon]
MQLAEKGIVSANMPSNGFEVDVHGLHCFAWNNPAQIILWNFRVLAFTTTPKINDEIYFYWGALNADYDVFSPSGGITMYIACQNPSGSWSDFGYSYFAYFAHTSYLNSPGGGGFLDCDERDNDPNPSGGFYSYQVSKKLDQEGTWRIIPDFQLTINGQTWYYPWYDATVYITVKR